MQLTPEQIDWIVAEVVRRLREYERAAGTEATAPGGAELALTDRVVTLATIDKRLAGVGRLRVASSAVVTPAVRDHLKDKNIALVRGD